MNAASRAAGVAVAATVAARDGSPVVDVDGRRCVLFEWVPGHQLREGPTPERVQATGALTARVHEQANGDGADPPTGAIVADRALYFRIETGSPSCGRRTGRCWRTRSSACRRRSTRSGAIRRTGPTCSTATSKPGNAIVDGDRVTLVDFQDLVWGFAIATS